MKVSVLLPAAGRENATFQPVLRQPCVRTSALLPLILLPASALGGDPAVVHVLVAAVVAVISAVAGPRDWGVGIQLKIFRLEIGLTFCHLFNY